MHATYRWRRGLTQALLMPVPSSVYEGHSLLLGLYANLASRRWRGSGRLSFSDLEK